MFKLNYNMSISKKGKRKTTVGNRLFLWWVFDEYDQTEFDGLQVKIVSEDQSIFIKYGLQQINECRYLVLSFNYDLGRVHIKCPKFESDNGIISSSGISRLILWSSSISDAEILHSWSAKGGILRGQDAQKTLYDLQINLQKT